MQRNENQKVKKRKRMRQYMAVLLVSVMILGAIVNLTPRAFAQEQDIQFVYTCGKEEHAHTAQCYEKVTSVEKRVLACSLEKQPEEADDLSQKTIVHRHDAACYAEDNTLVCVLPEREAHTHGEECYTTVQEPVCQFAADQEEEHIHTEECYRQLSCGKEELILHSHTQACGETCTIPVVEEHIHTDDCFIMEEVLAEDLDQLTCDKTDETDHVHTDLCYGTWTLICGLEEHSHEECPQIMIDNTPGEQAIGTNWMAGRGDGQYVPGTIVSVERNSQTAAGTVFTSKDTKQPTKDGTAQLPSSVQIHDEGGEKDTEDQVAVSKTIAGTETENVFDITLRVDTKTNIQKFLEKPDMAVVIVMDISKTMDSNFGKGTRYDAAMDAAEVFVDLFTGNTSDTSKLGVVAFNTDAHKIMELQPVNSAEQAVAFSTAMKHATDAIMNGYTSSDPDRFTNIEAGLAMANDWLKQEQTENKFVLFLSDGMPTTYIKSGYIGYVPENRSGNLGTKENAGTDGNFYDGYNNRTMWTTNYSDKGAVRARNMASILKANGVSVFSTAVGMDEVDQFLYTQLVTRPATGGASTVDCPIGTSGVESLDVGGSFVNWLTTAIASDNQFINCADPSAMEQAYKDIFNKFKQISIENSAELWTVVDRIPEDFEFIAFHDNQGSITDESGNLHTGLSGSLAAEMENTISHADEVLTWNLKKSGYSAVTNGDTTDYAYSVTYRVRLKNEAEGFVEKNGESLKIYPTNESAILTYNTVKTVNGIPEVSGRKTVAFEIPSVVGYLGDLEFTKQDQDGNALAGATFTLSHDTETCSTCRGDGMAAVTVADMTAVSDANGKVNFVNIPSGHIYILQETGVPNGYTGDNTTYTVTVAYDEVTAKAGEETLTTVVNRALETTAEIVGTKYLTNPDGAEHVFTFEMIEVDQYGSPIPGKAAVTSTVTYDAASDEKEQSFTLGTLTYNFSDLDNAASKTYYYKVSEKDRDNTSLNADETYYIVQVDVNLADDGSGMTATQTIYQNGMDTEASSIVFTNTLLGQLQVSKELVQLDEEATSDRAFDIKVIITGPDIRSGMEYTLDNRLMTVSGDSLEIDVSLKHGDTAVIGQIPSGSYFTVEEAEMSAYGYDVTYVESNIGTVTTKTGENPYVAVQVINTELQADLVIEGTKKIANPDGEEHTYGFRLTEVDRTGDPVVSGITQQVSLQVEDEADFSFELNYQSDMLADSTNGSRIFYYLIEEITTDDGMTVDADETVYLVKVELDGKNDQLSAKILDCVMMQGKKESSVKAVTFTNSLLGSLTLSKQIIGEYPAGETFEFTITGLPDGEYIGTLNDSPYAVNVTNSVCTIKLSHEDSLVIYGIPHGTKVTIVEAESEYTVRYEVNSGWQNNGNKVTAEITTDGTEVLFKNYSPDGLPQTGQLNWPIPVLAILGLLFIGVSMGLMSKKKGQV